MTITTKLFESPEYKKREDYSDEGILEHARRMVRDWQEYALRLEEAIEVLEGELEERGVDIFEVLDNHLQVPEREKNKRKAKMEESKTYNCKVTGKVKFTKRFIKVHSMAGHTSGIMLNEQKGALKTRSRHSG